MVFGRGIGSKSSAPSSWKPSLASIIVRTAQINVLILSVQQTVSDGKIERSSKPRSAEVATDVFGLLDGSCYLPVRISFGGCMFGDDRDAYGCFSYDVYTPHDKQSIAFLSINVESRAASILWESHRNALQMGHKFSRARFFKEKDRDMTPLELNNAVANGSIFELFGMTAWSDLQNSALPKWAQPFFDDTFAADNLPADGWFDRHLK